MGLIIGIGVVLLLLITVVDIALMRMASRTSRQEEWEEERNKALDEIVREN